MKQEALALKWADKTSLYSPATKPWWHVVLSQTKQCAPGALAEFCVQTDEASGSEEEAPAEAEGQEEGEIVAPQTPADKKAQRLAARRAVLKAADDELKVCAKL